MSKDLFVQTSLGLPTGRYLRHGDRVPEGVFSQEVIERLLSKGVIVRVAAKPTRAAEPAAGGNAIKQEKKGAVSNQEEDRSRWAYPNEMLDGRDLDTLNIMIREHATLFSLPEVEPFDTVEEARAFLQHELS